MDRRVAVPLSFVALAVALVVVGAAGQWGAAGYRPAVGGGTTEGTDTDGETDTPSAYEHATVRFVDGNGTVLGVVRVAVAETRAQKYTGLSETDSLPPDRGMLFPYDRERDLTYVMRNMSFGIDIVYVAANGTVTRIHHAPEPPEDASGEDYRYPGRGKYVIEVNYGWTTRHGVEVGDRVVIEGYEGYAGRGVSVRLLQSR